MNEILGRAFSIHATDKFLIIRNDLFETKLTAIQPDIISRIHHFGKYGEEPNELINPSPILINAAPSITVYDGAKKALLEFDLNKIGTADSLMTRSLALTKPDGIISMINLSDFHCLASGIFPEGRFCLLDKNENIHTYPGNYPGQESIPKNLPFHVSGMAYQSSICKQHNGNRFALAARYGDIMQIYEWDPSTRTINDVCLIEGDPPKFTTGDINGSPNFRPDKDTKWGYLSVDATENISMRYIPAVCRILTICFMPAIKYMFLIGTVIPYIGLI